MIYIGTINTLEKNIIIKIWHVKNWKDKGRALSSTLYSWADSLGKNSSDFPLLFFTLQMFPHIFGEGLLTTFFCTENVEVHYTIKPEISISCFFFGFPFLLWVNGVVLRILNYENKNLKFVTSIGFMSLNPLNSLMPRPVAKMIWSFIKKMAKNSIFKLKNIYFGLRNSPIID